MVLLSSGSSRVRSNALSSQNPSQLPQKPKRTDKKDEEDFKARLPTIDYDAPEPSNLTESAKRKEKNKHFDRHNLVMKNPTSDGGVVVPSEFFENLPALPVKQSDVILTASVLNSKAHLSNDKSGIYTDFDVQVSDVLKGAVPSSPQNNLSLSRFGGTVRYPSGRKMLYSISQQKMPAVGKQYLFFLQQFKESQDYLIITGYEIGQERVEPLDYLASFQVYRGADSVVFLNTVRDAIR
jgi:hypothetical protein